MCARPCVPQRPEASPGLAEGVLRGDRLSISRAISQVEREGTEGWLGKSTLIGQVARAYRARGERVGVLAVDPTSPYSGGALLGDRIRMRDLAGDPGVFVRSMATRGASGGLSRAVSDAIVVLDAAGYGVILVETVGAGQDEVAIARLAHTVVVVEAPGLGDDIQAIKAGLLEVADVIVVNKGDRDGADQAARFLEAMIERVQNKDAWRVSVCQTVALDGTGMAALVDQIEAHRAYLAHSGQWAEPATNQVGSPGLASGAPRADACRGVARIGVGSRFLR